MGGSINFQFVPSPTQQQTQAQPQTGQSANGINFQFAPSAPAAADVPPPQSDYGPGKAFALGALTGVAPESPTPIRDLASGLYRIGSDVVKAGFGGDLTASSDLANIGKAAFKDTATDVGNVRDLVLASRMGGGTGLDQMDPAELNDKIESMGRLTSLLATFGASGLERGAIESAAESAVKGTGEAIKSAAGATAEATGKALQNKAVATLGGTVAGSAAERLLGKGFGLGGLTGAYVGRQLLPSLGEKLQAFGQSLRDAADAVSGEAPGVSLKVRSGAGSQSIPVNLVTGPDGRSIVILPGEETDPMAARNAGSAAQATTRDLQRLAAAGDRSAQLELVRRRIPMAGSPIDYSKFPLPRGGQ